MFRWFETLIDPFQPAPLEQPPAVWTKFYWHYVRQVWPAFLGVLVFGFFAGVIELALFAFLGELVDLARDAATPADFFAEHGSKLVWMAVTALLLRPIVYALHVIMINQVINANFTNLVRGRPIATYCGKVFRFSRTILPAGSLIRSCRRGRRCARP